MEVIPAVRRHLMTADPVAGYVQARVYKRKLYEHVNGLGTRAIVVRHDGGWRAPDDINTARYPIVAVDCWADCSRGEDKEILQDDALDNAWAVYNVVDPVLARKRNVFWGAFGVNPGLYVVESSPWQEPLEQTRDESHQGSFHGVKLMESAVVTARYALVVG